MKIENSHLPLERAYRWERERPADVYMTQPLGGGQVREYTWAQSLDEARRMAAYLQAQNFPKGSHIAILSKNCAEFIIAELAIWMSGHVTVALFPTVNADTIRYVLSHCEAKLLFVGKLDTWAEQKSAVPPSLPCVALSLAPQTPYPRWPDLIAKTSPIAGSPVRGMDDTCTLFYTSGSTGQPKGVEHTFGTSVAAVMRIVELVRVTPQDRVISYLPLAHVFERGAVELLSLYVGVHVFFAESLETFLQDVQRARPTMFHSVPRLWLKFQQGVLKKLPQKKLDRLLRIPIVSGLIRKKILRGLGLDQCRVAITGSAPTPPEQIQWYRNLGLELLEGYGMTEDFVCSHLSYPGRARAGYVGHPLPDVETRISPEGEIQIKSPGCMKGYYKLPDLTKESFTSDGFFKTGDRGEHDSDGRLRITGRVKELFKTSKGKYVAPSPIENLLNAHSSIELSCVTGSGLPQPLAVIMLAEDLRKQFKEGRLDRVGLETELTALHRQVNAQIEEWERLTCLVVVTCDDWQIDNGFLTPTMKLKRSVVDDRYGMQLPLWSESRKLVVWHS